MTLIVGVQSIPLKADKGGVMRVGETRGTLDKAKLLIKPFVSVDLAR